MAIDPCAMHATGRFCSEQNELTRSWCRQPAIPLLLVPSRSTAFCLNHFVKNIHELSGTLPKEIAGPSSKSPSRKVPANEHLALTNISSPDWGACPRIWKPGEVGGLQKSWVLRTSSLNFCLPCTNTSSKPPTPKKHTAHRYSLVGLLIQSSQRPD